MVDNDPRPIPLQSLEADNTGFRDNLSPVKLLHKH